MARANLIFLGNNQRVIGRQTAGGSIKLILVDGVNRLLPVRRQTGYPSRPVGNVG